jgi:hypothetical protein
MSVIRVKPQRSTKAKHRSTRTASHTKRRLARTSPIGRLGGFRFATGLGALDRFARLILASNSTPALGKNGNDSSVVRRHESGRAPDCRRPEMEIARADGAELVPRSLPEGKRGSWRIARGLGSR